MVSVVNLEFLSVKRMKFNARVVNRVLKREYLIFRGTSMTNLFNRLRLRCDLFHVLKTYFDDMSIYINLSVDLLDFIHIRLVC